MAVIAAIAFVGGLAHAGPARGEIDAAYIYDGGAVPLFWLPLAGTLALDHWVTARSAPLWFNAREGGTRPTAWEVPGWSLTAAGLGLGLAMIAGGDDARWDHAKGLAEAMATSAFVVSMLKPAIGRHRPDWSADSVDLARNTSFPSGHATNAFAISTYAALYLHAHVFDARTSGWWQGVAYAGLYAGAVLIAAERVYHDRHHLSDVIAGSLIGTAASVSMFYYQEQRFRAGGDDDAVIAPRIGRGSVMLGLLGGAW